MILVCFKHNSDSDLLTISSVCDWSHVYTNFYAIYRSLAREIACRVEQKDEENENKADFGVELNSNSRDAKTRWREMGTLGTFGYTRER